MTTTLFIHVVTGLESEAESEAIKFFEAETWDNESEMQLMARIRELLGTVRGFGKSFQVNIELEVSDIHAATFFINKKAGNQVEINRQKLTIREIEVLGLIMQGYTNNEIAGKLFVSYETVKSHRKNILAKTGAKNTAALINYYHQTFFEKPS